MSVKPWRSFWDQEECGWKHGRPQHTASWRTLGRDQPCQVPSPMGSIQLYNHTVQWVIFRLTLHYITSAFFKVAYVTELFRKYRSIWIKISESNCIFCISSVHFRLEWNSLYLNWVKNVKFLKIILRLTLCYVISVFFKVACNRANSMTTGDNQYMWLTTCICLWILCHVMTKLLCTASQSFIQFKI